MFISKMDNTHTGITGRIGQYIELLQRHDRMVENRLRAQVWSGLVHACLPACAHMNICTPTAITAITATADIAGV